MRLGLLIRRRISDACFIFPFYLPVFASTSVTFDQDDYFYQFSVAFNLHFQRTLVVTMLCLLLTCTIQVLYFSFLSSYESHCKPVKSKLHVRDICFCNI